MTFDNYCTGKCNRMAYLISRAVVEEAELICDFLVLEGVRGTGKTHLLHAIAHYARLINPDWLEGAIQNYLEKHSVRD